MLCLEADGFRPLSERQRSLQYKTWSQFLAQLLRQTMGRPQTKQGFCGRPCLLPLNPVGGGILISFLFAMRDKRKN